MLKAGIWILRPDYIAEYLMQEPVPPASKFVIPEVHKLNEEDSETYENASNKKRKAEDVRPSQRSKRSRK